MDGLALRARTAGWTVNDDHEEGLDEHDIGRADEEVMKRPMKLGRQRPHRSWYLSRKRKSGDANPWPPSREQNATTLRSDRCRMLGRHLRQRLIDIGMEIGNDDDLMSMFVEGERTGWMLGR
jgi:hypothetical protein